MNLLQLLFVHICGFKTNEGNKGQNKAFKTEVCKTRTCKTLFSLKTNFSVTQSQIRKSSSRVQFCYYNLLLKFKDKDQWLSNFSPLPHDKGCTMYTHLFTNFISMTAVHEKPHL